jgi:hypothetical protein
MPLRGSPQSAARVSARRGDHRLMAYQQNGFAVMLVIPGVQYCDSGEGLSGWRTKAFRLLEISKGSTPCCDMRWTPNACGVRQEDYAAAYNLEMIRIARRRVKCRELLVVPGVR